MDLSWFDFLLRDYSEIMSLLKSIVGMFPPVIFNLMFFCPGLVLVWTLIRYVRELRS